MPTVWLIGRYEETGTASLPAILRARVAEGSIVRFRSPGDALRSSVASADLVLVVQHQPSEFSERDIETLIGSQPLARFVVGLGPWCASHGRSERTWPDAITVPLGRVPARLRLEFDVLAGWSATLPLTAGADEVFAWEAAAANAVNSGQTIKLAVADRALRESLAELIRDADGTLADILDDPHGGVIVVDVDPICQSSLRRFTRLHRRRPTVRLIAMTASPNPADTDRLRRCGADHVLPKPFLLADLREAFGEERW